MTAMIFVSIILVVLGVGMAVWMLRGLPESVSAMVYALPPKGGWRWLWSVWLILVGIATFAPVIEILDARGAGILGFLPLVLIGFVAAWPLFDEEHRGLHNAFGITAGILSQVCVALISPWWLMAWTLMVAAWIWTTNDTARTAFDGKGVLLAEAVCYVAIIGAVLTAGLA